MVHDNIYIYYMHPWYYFSSLNTQAHRAEIEFTLGSSSAPAGASPSGDEVVVRKPHQHQRQHHDHHQHYQHHTFNYPCHPMFIHHCALYVLNCSFFVF